MLHKRGVYLSSISPRKNPPSLEVEKSAYEKDAKLVHDLTYQLALIHHWCDDVLGAPQDGLVEVVTLEFRSLWGARRSY